jgi:hypothetical protein
MKVPITALAVALALPTAASAADTPYLAPEGPVPVTGAARLPALGTDVAAPDQQAPKFPSRVTVYRPQPSTAQATGGFDWADAGVGAGGAALLLTTSLGAALTLRRRQGRPPLGDRPVTPA